MMTTNAALTRARSKENRDEWYTPYRIVEEELTHYSEQFSGKKIYCNCDDPFRSQFTRYFLENFHEIGLKELVSTSHIRGGRGLILRISGIAESVDDTIRNNTEKLAGNGDFRSEECVSILKECDVCVTNPPFSLFNDLISLLEDHDKSFLMIGNMNALTYKGIFPHIMDGTFRIGHRFGDMEFMVPDDTEPRATRYWQDDTGQKWRSLGNAMWLTNLNVLDRPSLKTTGNTEKYRHYDGQDIIDVPRVSMIPTDYDGVMGVPITFLRYYDPRRMEIVGVAKHGCDHEWDYFVPKIDGKSLFTRILVRFNKNEKQF